MISKVAIPLSILNFAVLILLVFLQFRTAEKIVYVDSVKLLNEYKGMQDARKVYQQKTSVWRSNIDTLSNDVQQEIMKYEKESARFTVKERKLSEELIRIKQKQLMEYQQSLNSQAQEEDKKMTSDVLVQVNAFLKKFGKERGYKIVMAATQYGNIAYADEGLDITEEVVKGLNQEYSGK